jgi:hypothetical protein
MPRHPLIDRILAPGVPRPLQLAAARGSVPVAVTRLLPALTVLAASEDGEIRDAATATIQGIGEPDLLEVAGDGETEPEVLEYLLLHRAQSREVLTALLAHEHIPDRALVRLAEGGGADAIDVLISNQERLIRTAGLVDTLRGNRSLTPFQQGRLSDFTDQFPGSPAAGTGSPAPPPVLVPEPAAGVPAAGSAAPDAGPSAGAPAGEGADFVSAEELKALLDEVGDLPFLSVELAGLLASNALVDDEFAQEIAGDETLLSTWKRLLMMNGVQRLKAALRGDKEVRGILIRDKNRLVSTAVLKNVRITIQEIESFASQRTISEEILRTISANREWMKNYTVLHQLVKNPKTPPGLAMNYMARLTLKDMQHLVRDRNIAEIVRRTARKHIDMRQKPARPVGKH